VWREGILLATLFFIPLAIYWVGLSGDYFLDDYAHIIHNTSIQIQQLDWNTLWTAANSTTSGPLGRPLALVTFGLNYYTTGLDPFYFKLVNVLLHLLTGIGVYFLTRRIVVRFTNNPAAGNIAFVTALLWLAHPLNVSTVLYAVQRMTVLSGLFTVWGMIAYCHGRDRLLDGSQHGWGWILLGSITGGIGLFAKETAVLILGYLLLLEWLVFEFQMPTKTHSRGLKTAYVLLIGVPLAWALTNHLFSPGWTQDAYASRTFTFNERLLTQTRVLWDYLYLTWLPDIQAMGLYHDGYRISHSIFDPPTTMAAITGHFLLIALAFALRKRWPLLLFAVAWFYVGHSAESTVLPLEIKYEHRNYLPMLGMLLLLVHGIYVATSSLKNSLPIRRFILIALILTFSGSTFVRSAQFGDFWGFAGMEAEHHPESSRANMNAAVSLIKLMMQTQKSTPELVEKATEYLRRSAQINPNSSAPLFALVLFLPEITHEPPPQEFVNELSHRLRNALPDANINTYFSAVLRQAEDKKLMLSNDQMYGLFDQAEANPHIRKGTKADIIAIRAAYAQSIEGNNHKARAAIDRALSTDPLSSGIYVPAVWIYQEGGMWQDAADLLQRLKMMDTFGIERKNIEWLSQRQKNK
jgi:hypothetical protein